MLEIVSPGEEGAPAPWRGLTSSSRSCPDDGAVARTTSALRPHVRRADARCARVRAAAVDGGARAARDAAGAAHLSDRSQLDPHGIPAHGVGCDAYRRAARRHVRQGARARDRAPRARRRNRHLGALDVHRPDARRSRHPGHRRCRLPARHRDRARRVPQGPRRHRYRPDLRDVRGRRRRRHRPVRPDRAAPRLPLPLLDPARRRA